MSEAALSFTLRHPPGLLGAPFSRLSDVAPGDVVLCGYFCDNLSEGPPGARFLARQLRYFSEDEAPLAKVHDLSDLNVFPLEPKKHEKALAEQLALMSAARAIPILVGGDRSGLDIMAEHAAQIHAEDTSVHIVTPGQQLSKTTFERMIVGVDLSSFSPSLDQLQALRSAIDALPDTFVSGAVFGSAPALDQSGAEETRFALAVLQALVRKVIRSAAHAPS